MKNRIHSVLGAVAFLLIASFLTSSIVGEFSGRLDWLLAIKRYIAYALLLLIPCMISTAVLGRSLATNRRGALIEAKHSRMRFIAANGMLVLTPLAISLYQLALRGSFGLLFQTLQALELVAGATNIYLLSLMMRDGFKLSGRTVRRKVPRTE